MEKDEQILKQIRRLLAVDKYYNPNLSRKGTKVAAQIRAEDVVTKIQEITDGYARQPTYHTRPD